MEKTCISLSFNVMEDCINDDSYGAICVHCNACGRLDKSTQKESALKMYREHLQREYEFNNWIEGFEELQRKNIKENIEYLKNKIAELEDC